MLGALTVLNVGAAELDYDQWLNVVFALHHETSGSEVGLALAHEVSARSIKYDPDRLDYVWSHMHSDREAVITGASVLALARGLGWRSAADDGDVNCFDVVADEGNAGGAGGAGGAAGAGATVERRGIPEARHLTTDQANAGRLVKAFGTRVLVCAGRWYAWSGRHWAPDESDVYRFACRLSGLIKDEADVWRAKARAAEGAVPVDVALVKRLDAIADALESWAKKSEMKATIEAALGLARKMLNVEPEMLDRDPWALNVLNGTVDLRTGVLRPHSSADFITKLVRLPYEAGADSAAWVRVLSQMDS